LQPRAKPAGELSGGELQRVRFARALWRTRSWSSDEPTGNSIRRTRASAGAAARAGQGAGARPLILRPISESAAGGWTALPLSARLGAGW